LAVATIDYCPRKHFVPFHTRTERWAILVCHRRAGKTVASINELIRAAGTTENGRFAYVAPLYTQAKDVAWQMLKEYARPVLAETPNESELRVNLISGSQIRLYGADNPDRLRGLGLRGVILDEFADMRPSIWEVIRPALADHKGWAAFIGTPKGHNAFYDIWAGNGEWEGFEGLFRLRLKASETGILDKKELEDALHTLGEDRYAQEMETSFEAALRGAVYGKLMTIVDDDKRVCGVPYDPASLVYTAWDLGIGDPTAIVFAQNVGKEVHIIDYYENSGADIAHYVGILKSKPYNYGGHIVPHDAQAKELGTGKSIYEVMQGLGLYPLTVCPNHRIEDGINATRLMIPRCYFDKVKTHNLVEALKQYQYEWDEVKRVFKAKPRHDWTSHAADAFRYLANGIDSTGAGGSFRKKINYPKLGKL
jgi:phage terminase large subunit